MTIFGKLKKAITILNIIILILIYVFSFYIFPKLNSNINYNFININTRALDIFSTDWILSSEVVQKKDEYINKKKNAFLLKFFYYLEKSPNILKIAPCPSELFENNIRNIQLYENFNNNLNPDYYKQFNVRFIVNKFKLEPPQKSDINKCFYFIFVENLNKFYLVERDSLIEELEKERTLMLNILGKDFSFSDDITFSNLITEIKNGNIASINFFGDYLTGVFKNKKKFSTKIPNNYNGLVELLISKGVTFSEFSPNIFKNIIERLVILENLIEQYKKNNKFINTEASYNYIEKNKKNKIWPEILVFLISISIFFFVKNFSVKYKKLIPTFLNKFINT